MRWKYGATLCVEGKFATLGGHSKERAEAVEHATAVEKIELASIQDRETLSFAPFELHSQDAH